MPFYEVRKLIQLIHGRNSLRGFNSWQDPVAQKRHDRQDRAIECADHSTAFGDVGGLLEASRRPRTTMGLRGNAIFTTEATGIGRALAEALLAKDNNAVISGRRKGSDP
jgi:hypothetical protein